jgi:hypothetical protein
MKKTWLLLLAIRDSHRFSWQPFPFCYLPGMRRVARIAVPGCRRHIIHRGNNRQDVFFTDDDRRLCLKALAEEDREALSDPRLHTNRGRPLGSDGFVARLEAAMNRRLRPLSEGRPRKKDENR